VLPPHTVSDQPIPFSSSAAKSPDHARERSFALLLGLHGLALMVVFPLGTQEARLWHPGVPGVAAAAAAFPLASVAGGLLARRLARLPSSTRSLALLAFLSTLPCALSFDHPSFLFARMIAGFATGIAYVAIHRVLPASAGSLTNRIAPRVVAFGLPVCLLGATLFDWRSAFIPLLAGQALIALLHFPSAAQPAAPLPPLAREAAPAALVATGALAYVSAAFLTVLSGFLVFNAGHTEVHIPLVLLLAALLGLAVPPALGFLRARFSPPVIFAATLGVSAASLVALLALRTPQPAALAVGVIAGFITANTARHLALAGLVVPSIAPAALPAHQTHTHLAHHLGSGLGALSAGLFITLTPGHTFTGMTSLLAAALTATALACVSGLRAVHPRRTPAPAPDADMARLVTDTGSTRV
jgi:predicted MFS family arabinose efflux permease